jgi:hypothetical protein
MKFQDRICQQEMPGSTNPWASELKARKTSGTRRPKTGNPDDTPDPEILLNKDKTRETETNPAALAEPPQIETRGGERAKQILEKDEKNDSAEKEAPIVKEVKKVESEVRNPAKVEMNKRPEEPRKAAPVPPPPPKTKVKTLPVEVEDGKGSLYQDARSHLKRVVTRQISRSKDENKVEEDEEDLTPIDRLIRQGSFEPTTTNNLVEKDSAKGRFLVL